MRAWDPETEEIGHLKNTRLMVRAFDLISMTYFRWVKYNFAADVPKDARCCGLVAKTNKPCEARPKYLINPTEKWACGRHLQKALPECSVCFCDMKRKDEDRLPCGHVFHTHCVKGWEAHTDEPKCPTCRAPYFASRWRPNVPPDELMVSIDWSSWCCEDEGCTYHHLSDHMKLFYVSIFMDLVQFGRFRPSTAEEFARREGIKWYMEFGKWLGQSVLEDGTVIWDSMNYDHPLIKQCHTIEKLLHHSPYLFARPD